MYTLSKQIRALPSYAAVGVTSHSWRIDLVVILATMLAIASPNSHAAAAPGYADLLRASMQNAPAMLEQTANMSAADADLRQARAWANPILSTQAENLGAPSLDGQNQRQDTYTITQTFEIGGKRSARIATETRRLDAVTARGRQAQVVFSAQLAIAYAAAEAAQQRKTLADEELSQANEDMRVAKALVKAGREARLRIAQAQASVAAAEANRHAAIADATEALERLSALAGVSEPYTAIDQSLLDRAAAPSLSSSAIDATPSVASAMAERDLQDAEVHFEEKKWIPDISINAGLRKFGWTQQRAGTFGLSATIPLFDRNNGGVSAAKARAQSAQARLDAAKLEAAAQKRSAIAQATAADKRLVAAEQAESAAAEAYRLGRTGYDAGKTPLLELLAIRRALSDAKTSTIDARLARIRALATLYSVEGRIAFGELK